MDPIDPRHDPPLSETDIQAYADGLLTPERSAHLRSYLGERPGEARRVAFYGRLNEQIQRSFRPTDEPLPARARGTGFARRVRAVMRHPLRALLTLVLACALALVAASGWMAASQVSPEALNNAAVMALAQAEGSHFGPATASFDGGRAPAPGPAAGAPAAPDLTPVGMHLVARSTLKLGPFARATEFVYLNAEGQPVVLLTAPARAASAQAQWSARRVGTLRLLTWTTRQQRYVLAGAADARGLMRAADVMTMH
jgi:hypothetical protein